MRCLLDPAWLDLVTAAQTRSGLLSLVLRTQEGGSRSGRARLKAKRSKSMRRTPMHAIAAVHQLLRRAGVFISAEKAGL